MRCSRRNSHRTASGLLLIKQTAGRLVQPRGSMRQARACAQLASGAVRLPASRSGAACHDRGSMLACSLARSHSLAALSPGLVLTRVHSAHHLTATSSLRSLARSLAEAVAGPSLLAHSLALPLQSASRAAAEPRRAQSCPSLARPLTSCFDSLRSPASLAEVRRRCCKIESDPSHRCFCCCKGGWLSISAAAEATQAGGCSQADRHERWLMSGVCSHMSAQLAAVSPLARPPARRTSTRSPTLPAQPPCRPSSPRDSPTRRPPSTA